MEKQFFKDLRLQIGGEGFTQKEFALWLGVSKSTVENWESRGTSDTIFKLLQKIYELHQAGIESQSEIIFLNKRLEEAYKSLYAIR